MSGLLSLLGGAAAAQYDIADNSLAAKRAKGLEEARAALEMKRARFNQGRNDARAETQNAYSLARDKQNNQQADARAQRGIDAANVLQDRREQQVTGERQDEQGNYYNVTGQGILTPQVLPGGEELDGPRPEGNTEGLLRGSRQRRGPVAAAEGKVKVAGVTMKVSDAVKIWTETANAQTAASEPVTSFKDWIGGAVDSTAPTQEELAASRKSSEAFDAFVAKYQISPEVAEKRRKEFFPSDDSGGGILNTITQGVSDFSTVVTDTGGKKENILGIPKFNRLTFSTKERKLNPSKVSSDQAANLKSQIKAQADVVIPALKSASATLSEADFKTFFRLNVKPYITSGKSFTTGKRHPAEVEYRKILDTVYGK